MTKVGNIFDNNENFLKTVRDSIRSGDNKAIDAALDQVGLRYGNIAKSFLESAIDRFKLTPDQIIGIFNKMIEHLDAVQQKIEKRIKERANSQATSTKTVTQEDKKVLIEKYSQYGEINTHKHCIHENEKEIKRLEKKNKELARKLRKTKDEEEKRRIKEEMKRNNERMKKTRNQNEIHRRRIKELEPFWNEFKAKNPEIASDIEKMWKENEGKMKESWEKYKAQNPEAASIVSEFCLSQAKKTFNTPTQHPRIPTKSAGVEM